MGVVKVGGNIYMDLAFDLPLLHRKRIEIKLSRGNQWHSRLVVKAPIIT